MTYALNVAENPELCEVINIEDLYETPVDPGTGLELIKNRLQHEMKIVLEKALEWERDAQIGAARHERGNPARQDSRNGYRNRELSTTMGTFKLRVPRGRKPLEFSVFEAYQRRWQDLDLLLLECHIGGMSCRQVGERIAALLGRRWSGATIAGLMERLTDALKSFRHAPLEDDYVALVVDGMFVGIRQCMEQKRPLVAVIGVRADGSCDLLATRVCYSENATEVAGLLRHVKERGVKGKNLQVITIDGDKGLEAAVCEVYGHVRIQDCVFHRINRIYKNCTGKRRAKGMMKEASAIFKEKDTRKQKTMIRQFTDKWGEKEPHAVECFVRDIYRSFEARCLPDEARSKATTSGLCEGLFKQLRARIKSIGRFETPQDVELYTFAIVAQKKWIGIPGREQAAPLLETFTHNY
jgi:transposase-like protein